MSQSPVVLCLTSRSTGRIARLSRGLHTQPARQSRCAGELRRGMAMFVNARNGHEEGLMAVLANCQSPRASC